jgi:hypothetical protein
MWKGTLVGRSLCQRARHGRSASPGRRRPLANDSHRMDDLLPPTGVAHARPQCLSASRVAALIQWPGTDHAEEVAGGILAFHQLKMLNGRVLLFCRHSSQRR